MNKNIFFLFLLFIFQNGKSQNSNSPSEDSQNLNSCLKEDSQFCEKKMFELSSFVNYNISVSDFKIEEETHRLVETIFDLPIHFYPHLFVIRNGMELHVGDPILMHDGFYHFDSCLSGGFYFWNISLNESVFENLPFEEHPFKNATLWQIKNENLKSCNPTPGEIGSLMESTNTSNQSPTPINSLPNERNPVTKNKTSIYDLLNKEITDFIEGTNENKTPKEYSPNQEESSVENNLTSNDTEDDLFSPEEELRFLEQLLLRLKTNNTKSIEVLVNRRIEHLFKESSFNYHLSFTIIVVVVLSIALVISVCVLSFVAYKKSHDQNNKDTKNAFVRNNIQGPDDHQGYVDDAWRLADPKSDSVRIPLTANVVGMD